MKKNMLNCVIFGGMLGKSFTSTPTKVNIRNCPKGYPDNMRDIMIISERPPIKIHRHYYEEKHRIQYAKDN